MPKDRVTLDEAYAGSTRAFFGSWFAMLGGMYVAIMFGVTFVAKAPVARALGLPANTAEAYLLDMTILIAVPMGTAIWFYVDRKKKQLRNMKTIFLDRQSGETLVSATYNPNTIYRLLDRNMDDGTVRITTVWNPNGPIDKGDTHVTSADAIEPLDKEKFLQQG